jgi:hypothetical protein
MDPLNVNEMVACTTRWGRRRHRVSESMMLDFP